MRRRVDEASAPRRARSLLTCPAHSSSLLSLSSMNLNSLIPLVWLTRSRPRLPLDHARLFQGAEDAVGGEQSRRAAGVPPAVRQPLRVGGAVRLRAQLQHLLPQQEGPAAALAAVPERWVKEVVPKQKPGTRSVQRLLLNLSEQHSLPFFFFFPPLPNLPPG